MLHGHGLRSDSERRARVRYRVGAELPNSVDAQHTPVGMRHEPLPLGLPTVSRQESDNLQRAYVWARHDVLLGARALGRQRLRVFRGDIPGHRLLRVAELARPRSRMQVHELRLFPNERRVHVPAHRNPAERNRVHRESLLQEYDRDRRLHVPRRVFRLRDPDSELLTECSSDRHLDECVPARSGSRRKLLDPFSLAPFRR